MSPVSKSGSLYAFLYFIPPLPSHRFTTKNCIEIRCFYSFVSIISRPIVNKSQQLFIIEKKRNVQNVLLMSVLLVCVEQQFTSNLSPSLSPAHHFWITASFPSAFLGLDFVQHCITSLLLRHAHPQQRQRETLSRSHDQTGNQPLNQICNLTLSTTHHWIPFNFDLFPSGLESKLHSYSDQRSFVQLWLWFLHQSVWHRASHSAARAQMEIAPNWINIESRRESCVLLQRRIGKLGS